MLLPQKAQKEVKESSWAAELAKPLLSTWYIGFTLGLH